jgi:hypothetical protein
MTGLLATVGASISSSGPHSARPTPPRQVVAGRTLQQSAEKEQSRQTLPSSEIAEQGEGVQAGRARAELPTPYSYAARCYRLGIRHHLAEVAR